MAPNPSRREFDALTELAKLLSQGQDAAASRATAQQEQITTLKQGLDLLAEEIRRQGAELQTLRAVVISLLRMADPHLPASLQGGTAAALQALERPR